MLTLPLVAADLIDLRRRAIGSGVPLNAVDLIRRNEQPVAALGRTARFAMGGGMASSFGGGHAGLPPALGSATPSGKPMPVSEFAKNAQDGKKDGLSEARSKQEDEAVRRGLGEAKGDAKKLSLLQEAVERKQAYMYAADAFKQADRQRVQAGKLGVDLSVQTNNLRNQARMEVAAQQLAYGRNCLEIGGVWIDEDFDAKMPTVTVKAQSDAYFRLLEKHPKLREIFRLGNHLVWVTPSRTALVVDTTEGKEKLSDEELKQLDAYYQRVRAECERRNAAQKNVA